MFAKEGNGQQGSGKDDERTPRQPNGSTRAGSIPLPGAALFGTTARNKRPTDETQSLAGDKPQLQLQPDPDVAIAYLRDTLPAGPWVLTAIIPDGSTKTRAFEANDHAGV